MLKIDLDTQLAKGRIADDRGKREERRDTPYREGRDREREERGVSRIIIIILTKTTD